ncbi:hypothetical protein E3D42_37450, partial [Burkholderia cepacia]
MAAHGGHPVRREKLRIAPLGRFVHCTFAAANRSTAQPPNRPTAQPPNRPTAQPPNRPTAQPPN